VLVLAGVLAGEQPAGVGQGPGGAEGLGDRERGHERVQRGDEEQRLGAESEVGAVLGCVDVVDRERHDLGEWLCVEQYEAGSDAVLDAGGVFVVEHPSDQGPVFVGVGVGSWPGLWDWTRQGHVTDVAVVA